MTNDQIIDGLMYSLAERFSAQVREAVEQQGAAIFLVHGSYKSGIRVAMSLARISENYKPVDEILEATSTEYYSLSDILWDQTGGAPAEIAEVIAGLEKVKDDLTRRMDEDG